MAALHPAESHVVFTSLGPVIPVVQHMHDRPSDVRMAQGRQKILVVGTTGDAGLAPIPRTVCLDSFVIMIRQHSM